MDVSLPEKLLDAEEQIHQALNSHLNSSSDKRITIDIRFEGLRLMPVVIRLFKKLSTKDITLKLLWPDAGATALARRDAPEIKDHILSFKEIVNSKLLTDESIVLIAISPQPYDYEEFENLSSQFNGKIIMINGRLDDAAVGIGSVARDRRKTFINKWQNVYWLEPIKEGALIHIYPYDWTLFKLSEDGYMLHDTFQGKPNPDLIFESLLNDK